MKLSFKRIFLALLLVAISIFFVAAFMILNRPSSSLTESEKKKALENILGRQVILQPTPTVAGNTQHQGKYVSFIYPKAAKEFTLLSNGQPAQFNDLEHFSFDLADTHTHFFSQVLAYPGTQALTDYPGVRLRQGEPDIYQQAAVVSADNQQGLAFSKYDMTAGYEKVAFFLVNGKIYTFSVQSPEQQALNDLFNLLIPTIKFLS
jgi:hypothetical protein